jgi:hypothetical protein
LRADKGGDGVGVSIDLHDREATEKVEDERGREGIASTDGIDNRRWNRRTL